MVVLSDCYRPIGMVGACYRSAEPAGSRSLAELNLQPAEEWTRDPRACSSPLQRVTPRAHRPPSGAAGDAATQLAPARDDVFLSQSSVSWLGFQSEALRDFRRDLKVLSKASSVDTIQLI